MHGNLEPEENCWSGNPFWGDPTPTDVWEDRQKLDHLYGQLDWHHRDRLEFAIEGNHITIRNKSREGR